MSNPNASDIQARDKLFIAGINKRLSNVQSLVIAGETYTPAQLTQLFQGQIDNAGAVLAAKAQYQDAMKVYTAQCKQLVPVVGGFRTQVRNLFGNAAAPLADFGLTPPKVAKSNLETKVTAVTKSQATRKARGTLGPKRRKSIKGTTPATTASSTAAPAATPKPTA